MKRRIVVSLMAMMMLVSLMAPAAFAVSPEDTEGQEKQLYSVTVDLADLMATGGSKYKSVDLSLILPARSSGWSSDVVANFSTIPDNATVENVEIQPGRVSGNGSLGGAIVVTKLAITSPEGKRVETTFDKNGMETMAFFGRPGSGAWTLKIYGSNVGTGLGTIKYSSTKVTIWYSLE